jgi:hypothetical protein
MGCFQRADYTLIPIQEIRRGDYLVLARINSNIGSEGAQPGNMDIMLALLYRIG